MLTGDFLDAENAWVSLQRHADRRAAQSCGRRQTSTNMGSGPKQKPSSPIKVSTEASPCPTRVAIQASTSCSEQPKTFLR
jgi:hypothetical protein